MNTKNPHLSNRLISMLAQLAATILVATSLVGCGKGMNGTYKGDSPIGTVTIEFKSGGKAFSSVMGQTRELSYTVEGDKVIFDTGKGKEVYTLQKDGSLSSGEGAMSITLKKM
jgi:uncharacterized lipoprotein YehR (DUF1307 family)